MRKQTSGRWVGRVATVVAVGVGMIGGVAAAAVADGPGPDHAAVVGESSSTSSGDDSTDSHEWA